MTLVPLTMLNSKSWKLYRMGRELEFKVVWDIGDVTWETLDNCQELLALDSYLEIKGIRDPNALLKPKKRCRKCY